jgi:gas vesicle protein
MGARPESQREDIMGYLRGVVHGLIIGGAVALLYAPKPGRQMREELSERLDQVRGQMQPVIDQAQGVVESARPQVERGISKAQQQAQRITRRGSESSGGGSAYGGSISLGTGSAPGPGV